MVSKKYKYQHIFYFLSALRVLRGLVLIFMVLSCNKSPTDPKEKRPQFNVQTPITQNTTWESGNDYVIRGAVTVQENAMLTINEDVNVYFTLDSLGNKGKLEVLGGIHADGVDSTGMIHFGPLNGGDDEAWGVEVFEGVGVAEFVFCGFINCVYGIRSSKTRISVLGCLFEGCTQGINVSECDSVVIIESYFENNDYGLKIELSGSISQPVKISDSSFSGQDQVAIEVKNQSHVFIERSLFLNNQRGGYFRQGSHIIMEYCEINGCDTGVFTLDRMNCQITHTIFINCDIAMYILPGAVFAVSESNIHNNKNWNVLTQPNLTELHVPAVNNWWGTTVVSEIEKMIYDINDNGLNHTYVHYQPIKNMPVTGAGIYK